MKRKSFVQRMLDTTLRELLLYAICIFIAYRFCKFIYYKLAYHFSDTVVDVLLFIGVSVAGTAIGLLVDYFMKKREKISN